MKLNRIPLERLREILAATERQAGPDSVSARILRRELERRERRRRKEARRDQ